MRTSRSAASPGKTRSDVPRLEGAGGGAADLAAPDHQHRVLVRLVDHEHRVERGDLALRADHDRDAVVGQHRVRGGWEHVSPLGISDEVQARELAQPGVGDGPPRQRGVVHGELRDHELLEPPHAVGPGGAHRHPAGEVLAEAVLQRQHRRGSAQLEHVDRILVLSERRDWHCRVFLSHGQRDVRIRGVFEVRDDEPRVGCPHGVVGGNGVDVAHHDDDSVGVEMGRGRRVGLDHAVADGLVLEALRGARIRSCASSQGA
jgi:hypothetical protein